MDPKYGCDHTNEWPAFRAHHIFWADAAHHVKTMTCSNVLLASRYFLHFTQGAICFKGE